MWQKTIDPATEKSKLYPRVDMQQILVWRRGALQRLQSMQRNSGFSR
jgi:hypothetical protein